MKEEEDIKYRLEKLRQIVKDNKAFLRNEDDITNMEEQEIEQDNHELNTRIKILDWVLN